jgi:SAM-dependent methyltransferase
MHKAAWDYVADAVTKYNLDQPELTVIDLGGRNVNGTVRDLFPNVARYVALDLRAAPGVDIVADAATAQLDERFDVVVSTELLEHAEHAAEIIANAHRHLTPGGVFVATMAGPRRTPHGASGEPEPPPGEFYRNIYPNTLSRWLLDAGFEWYEIDELGADVRCVARRSNAS